jgi:hypothetical protein
LYPCQCLSLQKIENTNLVLKQKQKIQLNN